MQFSCSLPIDPTPDRQFLSVEAIAEMAQAMERYGIGAAFVTDHPAPSARWAAGGGHSTLDPFVALSMVAATTTTLRLQTHILVLAYRNPFIVAKAAASLDALSDGRFTMGIGTGYLKPEYAALGVSFEDRGEITDESIRIMRQAWTGEAVAHEGPRFQARDTLILPQPLQPGGVPIWAGGNAERAIRRAVELCDGWCPFPAQGIVTKTARTEELSTVAHLREKIAYAREHAEKIGRTAPLTVCVGRVDSRHAKPFDKADAAEAVDAYSELVAEGVSWATMGVPSPSRAAFIENLQWFGEEIIAKVRDAAPAHG